jgi:hypothetical protein
VRLQGGAAMRKPTLERLALSRLREQFPDLRRGGFSRAIRSLEPSLDERVRFTPDGWFAQHVVWPGGAKGVVFTCIEIEDQHPLSADKLRLYCDLWNQLDCLDHDLRLLVFDRYGFGERELDLHKIFLTIIIEEARDWRLTASPAELEAARKRAIPIKWEGE